MLLIGSSDIFFFFRQNLSNRKIAETPPPPPPFFSFFFFFFKKKSRPCWFRISDIAARDRFIYITFFLIYNDKRSDLIGMRNDVQNKPPMARYEDM